MEGKAREDFEKWYRKNNTHSRWVNFEVSGKSMQFGVIQDFFSSKGIEIDIKTMYKSEAYKGHGFFIFYKDGLEHIDSQSFSNTRSEARESAINKACEIYNKQNK